MNALWRTLIARYAARSQRERLLIAALLVIGLPLAALSLWVEPGWRAHLALQAELEASRAESTRLGGNNPLDPNAMARTELANLQAQLIRWQANPGAGPLREPIQEPMREQTRPYRPPPRRRVPVHLASAAACTATASNSSSKAAGMRCEPIWPTSNDRRAVCNGASCS